MLENVKSMIIINIIFKNIKNKRKLKIIKYNKSLMNKLHITIDDFKVYEILKEFNNKYNLDIGDIDDNELCLNYKGLENEGLKYFNEIKFYELEYIFYTKIPYQI